MTNGHSSSCFDRKILRKFIGYLGVAFSTGQVAFFAYILMRIGTIKLIPILIFCKFFAENWRFNCVLFQFLVECFNYCSLWCCGCDSMDLRCLWRRYCEWFYFFFFQFLQQINFLSDFQLHRNYEFLKTIAVLLKFQPNFFIFLSFFFASNIE